MDDDLSLYVPYREPDHMAPHGDGPTLAAIRYAEQLRLRVRETYLSRPQPVPSPWIVHVD